MRRNLHIVMLALVIGGVIGVVAGSVRAESVFNLNLLGERIDAGDAGATALGGNFMLMNDSLSILQTNTAMLSLTKRVTFSATQYFGTHRSSSQDYDRTTNSYRFTAVSVAFPLTHFLTTAIGFRANYDPKGAFSIPQTTDAGQEYTDNFTRTGAVSSFPLQIATTFRRYLRIGGYYAFENGNLKNQWEVRFSDVLTFQNATSTQRYSFSGSSFGGGVVLTPHSRISIGATYRSQIDYDATVRIVHTNSSANDSYNEIISMPPVFTGSARLGIARNMTLHVGGSYSDFTQFRGMAFPTDRLTEELVAGAGFEHSRGPGKPIRMSFAYQRFPYTLPDGRNVIKMSGAIGTSLKLSGGKGKVDLTFEGGQTGAVGDNGFSDRFVRLYVNLTGSEAWTRPPPRH